MPRPAGGREPADRGREAMAESTERDQVVGRRGVRRRVLEGTGGPSGALGRRASGRTPDRYRANGRRPRHGRAGYPTNVGRVGSPFTRRPDTFMAILPQHWRGPGPAVLVTCVSFEERSCPGVTGVSPTRSCERRPEEHDRRRTDDRHRGDARRLARRRPRPQPGTQPPDFLVRRRTRPGRRPGVFRNRRGRPSAG